MGAVQSAAKGIPDRMIDRQKDVQLAQREMMMATQVAKMRDDFRWVCAFHGTMGSLLTLGAIKLHKPQMLVPLIPMGFSASYLYDAAYGTKMERIVAGSEAILADPQERARFMPPAGNRLITREEYALRIINPNPMDNGK